MKLLVLTFILSLSTGVFAKEVKPKCKAMAESPSRTSVEKSETQKSVKRPAKAKTTSSRKS